MDLLTIDIKQGHVKSEISKYSHMKRSNKAIQSVFLHFKNNTMWLCTQISFGFVDSPMAKFNRVGTILFDHVYHDRTVQKNSN